MAEYIEREALLKDISESVVFSVKGGQPSLEIRGANKITDRIKAAPAADVVEVVRCEKCLFYEEVEYYHPTDKNPTKNVCRLFKRQMQPNDFCSYGERKCEDG